MRGEPTTESALVGRIVEALRKEHPDAWVLKVVGSPWQMTGVPDLLACIDGLFFGLEVKHIKPGETRDHARDRATPGQRIQINRITRAGGRAAIVTSVAEALQQVREGLETRN